MTSRLATGNGAIVTTDTGTNDLVVINCATGNRCPGCWAWFMTGIASVRGINMTGGLATGNGAIMTAGTGTNHISMVNRIIRNGCPRCRAGLMTGIAGIRTTNMIGGFT